MPLEEHEKDRQLNSTAWRWGLGLLFGGLAIGVVSFRTTGVVFGFFSGLMIVVGIVLCGIGMRHDPSN